MKESDGTPEDKNHHHHGGDDHDLDRFGAGLVHTLRVLPPEIKSDQNAEDGGESVVGKMVKWVAEVESGVLNETGEVLSGDHGTEGAGQDVIEQQRGDRKFRQRPAHGP